MRDALAEAFHSGLHRIPSLLYSLRECSNKAVRAAGDQHTFSVGRVRADCIGTRPAGSYPPALDIDRAECERILATRQRRRGVFLDVAGNQLPECELGNSYACLYPRLESSLPGEKRINAPLTGYI